MLGLAGFALTFTACDSATETGLEKLIESQGGGNVDLDLNGDGGFSVQTEEGGMSIDENGNFVVTDGSGSVVTGNADTETGEFNVETEDGSFSSGSTTEIPDNWPSNVPRPDALAIINATSMETPDGTSIQVTGNIGDPAPFVDDYASRLQAAGFTTESFSPYQGEESWVAVFEGPFTVVLNLFALDDSETTVTVSVVSSN
jgi:hypothetical protein